ncbi:MAG: hypothetical protein QXZ13_02310 [Candidatus Diapherotrites archaeon]
MLEELFHLVGGFLMGVGFYQFFFVKKGEKFNVVLALLFGVVGYIIVEFVFHGGF